MTTQYAQYSAAVLDSCAKTASLEDRSIKLGDMARLQRNIFLVLMATEATTLFLLSVNFVKEGAVLPRLAITLVVWAIFLSVCIVVPEKQKNPVVVNFVLAIAGLFALLVCGSILVAGFDSAGMFAGSTNSNGAGPVNEDFLTSIHNGVFKVKNDLTPLVLLCAPFVILVAAHHCYHAWQANAQEHRDLKDTISRNNTLTEKFTVAQLEVEASQKDDRLTIEQYRMPYKRLLQANLENVVNALRDRANGDELKLTLSHKDSIVSDQLSNSSYSDNELVGLKAKLIAAIESCNENSNEGFQ
jgi:hypothetical protein